MQKVNVREARQHIGRLLDAVTAGEEIVILRRGRPVAKLLKADREEMPAQRFPCRHEFRAKLPPARRLSADLIRGMRDERG